jgi:hypothetical protein
MRWRFFAACLSGWGLLEFTASGQSVIVVPPPSGITFSGLPGTNGAPYTQSTEGTFAVAATSGGWFQSLVYGNPASSIYVGPLNAPATGVIQITDGAGPFAFTGLDFSSNNGPSTYDIHGYLGSSLQYEETGTFAAAFSPFHFSSLQTGGPNVPVDALLIEVIPGAGATSVNLDNILVATVPEPGTALLGMVGLFVLRHRRPS